MENVSARLREAMEIRNMKQSDIIEKTGINKGAISSYLSGRYKPKQDNIYLLAQALSVSETWLMGLDVPMDPVNKINQKAAKNQHGLLPDESCLLGYYHQLNGLGQEEARKRLQELTEIDRYKK